MGNELLDHSRDTLHPGGLSERRVGRDEEGRRSSTSYGGRRLNMRHRDVKGLLWSLDFLDRRVRRRGGWDDSQGQERPRPEDPGKRSDSTGNPLKGRGKGSSFGSSGYSHWDPVESQRTESSRRVEVRQSSKRERPDRKARSSPSVSTGA